MYSLEKKITIATTLLFIFVAMSISTAFAQTPSLNVEPATSVINIGDQLTVNITLRNIASPAVYSYQLKLYYNASLLDVVSAGMPPGHFLTPTVPGKIFVVDDGVVNTAVGYVSFAATLLSPEQPKNGSGVLGTITFSGKAVGVSQLILNRTGLKLVDSTANTIPQSSYQINDGQVTVVPELSVTLMALLFLVATAAVVALRHKVAPTIKKRAM